ncbi:MAG: hypothetical protein EOP11_08835 [Proteobacteria bacterium]|nr:MAG: hypothetical protein EOP11_08835 [Pseudomonadota bacterium]
MNNRLKFGGTVLTGVGALGILAYVINSRALGTSALVAAVYAFIAGLALLFFHRRIGAYAEASARARAEARPRIVLSPSELRIRIFSTFAFIAAAGLALLIPNLRAFLWPYQSWAILMIAALSGTWMIRGFLARRSPKNAPAPRRSAAPLLVPSYAAVLAAALIGANAFLDFSSASGERASVIGKFEKRSEREVRHYVELGSIGRRGPLGAEEVIQWPISEAEYARVDPLTTEAMLAIHPGLFRLPWIESVRLEKLMKEPTSYDSAEAARQLIEEARQNKAPLPPPRTPDAYREKKWPNGQLKERVPLVRGKEEGLARYWHANGRVLAEIPYRAGKMEGSFRYFREDGSPEKELRYRGGQLHGLQRYFKPDGGVEREEFFYEGERR